MAEIICDICKHGSGIHSYDGQCDAEPDCDCTRTPDEVCEAFLQYKIQTLRAALRPFAEYETDETGAIIWGDTPRPTAKQYFAAREAMEETK